MIPGRQGSGSAAGDRFSMLCGAGKATLMPVKATVIGPDEHGEDMTSGVASWRAGDTVAPEREEAGTDPFRASLDWWGVVSEAGEIGWTRRAGRRAIAAAVARRFAELTRFARANSPFYRDAWRSLSERDLSLQHLPVVTKGQLMKRFDDWMTDREVHLCAVERFLEDRTHIGERFLGRFVIWKSSGSTGEPGIFVQDPMALSTYDALLVVQLQSLQLSWRYAWGLLAQAGRAALIAATGDHFASIASWRRVCRGASWPNARTWSVMEPLRDLVAKLNDYQPAFLASYPTTLAVLATEQREGRLRIAPSCVWSGGEFLSDSARAAIEVAFGAVLVNEYGASECMSIGFSCPRGCLHVNSDWVVLEPVDRNYRPTPAGGASHTVLLTNLANRVQPIIRYDLGDSVTASVGTCACGSPLPAIRAEGRRDDILALRAGDGRIVQLSPLALTTVVEDAIARHRFQLVQTAPDRISVRIAGNDPGERRAEWSAARRALRAYLSQQSLGNVKLRLEPRAPVRDARSGKLREVIADVGEGRIAHARMGARWKQSVRAERPRRESP
jgi:phenylacetate-CoA ligase